MYVTNIAVFPNPVSDVLFIASEGIAVTKYIIYTTNGERILSEESNPSSVDVSGLSEGMYFIEILSEGRKSIQKFIKK